MKWKDTGEMVDKEDSSVEEENFDEEQYSPWSDKKGTQKPNRFLKIPVLFVLLGTAIVALVAVLLMMVVGGKSGTASSRQLASFDERLQKLEDRLDNFKAIDEKVTRIWEQAKSFEKFKDRFDRSEASISLRMDHLTMSLETLQKQLTEAHTPEPGPAASVKKDPQKNTNKIQYHQVQLGDTCYSISKKYKLKVKQLLELNQLKPDSVIQPGQKLKVRRP
jgi:hypothetical protein